MKLKSTVADQVRSLTVSIRPKPIRMGTEHVYELNGSWLRDVLVNGRWVTVAATATLSSHLESSTDECSMHG
ncbi:hypothetical protein [Burkholderia sp. Bp8986]|uniref:hypothetical protein n=1 Tax=Burkholderia sp. Bp8986 TaxID=2184550 RepID=UPI000F59F361|nr:hypothetical protein [Burkholderia sp. Bp8986]RQS43392.1 hypothetical protein DID99_35160 [Burkholderia sp. Bp8986]